MCLVFYHSQVFYVLALVGKIKRTFLLGFFGSHGIRIQLAHRRAEKTWGLVLVKITPKKRNRCLSPNSRKKEHVRQTPGYCSLSDRWRVTKYGAIPKSRIYISADVYANKCELCDVLHLLITWNDLLLWEVRKKKSRVTCQQQPPRLQFIFF